MGELGKTETRFFKMLFRLGMLLNRSICFKIKFRSKLTYLMTCSKKIAFLGKWNNNRSLWKHKRKNFNIKYFFRSDFWSHFWCIFWLFWARNMSIRCLFDNNSELIWFWLKKAKKQTKNVFQWQSCRQLCHHSPKMSFSLSHDIKQVNLL
jgi:hypothetical protein